MLRTDCKFSQLEALGSRVLILRPAGRQGYRPFIGSRSVRVTWHKRNRVIWSQSWAFAEFSNSHTSSFPWNPIHGFLAGHAVFCGARTLISLAKFPSGTWRRAGTFTAHIWASAWLPSGHLWQSGFFCADFFRCSLWRTLKFAFLCSWV